VSELLSGRLVRGTSVGAGASTVLAWADVEPVEGGLVLPLGMVRMAGASRMRLTIRGGIDAPGWLRLRTGTVPIVRPDSERLMGRSALWWTGDYIDAWLSLQTRLAAALDGDDRVAEVTLGCPLAGTGDPFARWGGLALNRASYVQAGWDQLEDWDATTAMIDGQATRWAKTTQTLWVASREEMSLGALRSHMEPVLALAESLAEATGERLLLGAARRLPPSAGFAGPLARLADATGPRSAVSAAGDEPGWQAVYDAAGIDLTSVEHSV